MKRAWFYLWLVGLVPVVVGGGRLWHGWHQMEHQWAELGQLQTSIAAREVRHREQRALLAQHGDADPLYIDHALEALPLCQKEVSLLHQLSESEPTLPSREILARQQLLSANRLSFSEGNVERGQGLSETVESLTRPVEIDNNDLQEILRRIEGDIEGKPQLVVTDLCVTRKKGYGDREVWGLDLKFLKREFR